MTELNCCRYFSLKLHHLPVSYIALGQSTSLCDTNSVERKRQNMELCLILPSVSDMCAGHCERTQFAHTNCGEEKVIIFCEDENQLILVQSNEYLFVCSRPLMSQK